MHGTDRQTDEQTYRQTLDRQTNVTHLMRPHIGMTVFGSAVHIYIQHPHWVTLTFDLAFRSAIR